MKDYYGAIRLKVKRMKAVTRYNDCKCSNIQDV